MPPSRLGLFLTRFLGPAALAACTGTVPKGTTGETGTLALDDVACLTVDVAVTCPSDEEARAALLGTTTCEDPVREVVATGAFVSEEEVVFTGYGGYGVYESGDTGTPQRWCCYEAAYEVHEGESCTIGRPLVVRGRTVSARRAERADWARALRPDLRGLSADARDALAADWTRAGLLEHASIPAFARVALDLAALGAPPELLARTAAAMRDEVAHAEACFSLASAYAGRPVGPGPLPVTRGRRPGLGRLAVEAFREGWVGETLAVGLAAAQLRDATDPAVCAVLGRIVRDEARHAALAWDIVRWAIARGGPSVRRAVAAEAARLQPDAGGDHGSTIEGVRGHGLPRPGLAREALAGVLADVIRPAAQALLAA